MKKRELKDRLRRMESMLHTAVDDVVEARDRAARWERAWHEGDAIRTKLQARIDELTGHRRAANARATKAETELAEARHKLGTVGWVHDEMTKALPGWQRAFAAHAGDRWAEGQTTAPEQLAWVLNRLVERVRAQGRKTDLEEG